jgi:hypothetical protein
MDFAHQTLQPRQEAVVIDAEFATAVAADAISTVMRPVPPRTRAK